MKKSLRNSIVSQVQDVEIKDERSIQSLIKTVRGVQVLLDRDMARLYGVQTGALNRQVKRNAGRFPEDFMFRLSADEWENLKCQNGISSWGGVKELYLIGASLKDLGAKCFAFTKLDSGEILRIKKSAYNPVSAAKK